MNRNRANRCTPLLPLIALVALLGGPRLCEASNDLSRRIAELASEARHSIPGESSKTDKPDQAPSISAAPDACVSKSDTDGRGSFALETAGSAAMQPRSISMDAGSVSHWQTPMVAPHSPPFQATAPPASSC